MDLALGIFEQKRELNENNILIPTPSCRKRPHSSIGGQPIETIFSSTEKAHRSSLSTHSPQTNLAPLQDFILSDEHCDDDPSDRDTTSLPLED